MELGLILPLYKIIIHCMLFFMVATIIIIVKQTNPVFAVFSFISTSFCAFLFFILIGAEFFALLILIIYTGVITVLFLFVVIMYNIKVMHLNWKQCVKNWAVLVCVVKFYKGWGGLHIGIPLILNQTMLGMENQVVTLDVVGLSHLFNEHTILFLFTGLLIFIAMLGSVAITYPFYKQNT